MKRSRSARYECLIREMWAARCMGTICPGVPIDRVPPHYREWVRETRRTICIPYWTQRALRKAKGPLFPK